MGDIAIFSMYMDAFAEVIGDGLDVLIPIATSFCAALAAISLGLLGLGMATRASPHMVAGVVDLALKSAFYLMVVQAAGPIGEGVLRGAVGYGQMATGLPGDASAFLSSPDGIMHIGFQRFVAINKLTVDLCDGLLGCMGALQVWGPMFLGAVCVLAAFGCAAIAILGFSVLFHLALLAGVLLIPLSIFRPFASFGWGPVQYLIHAGVQLFVLMIVIGVNERVFNDLLVGEEPGWAAVLPTILACAVMVGTIIGSARLAYSLTSRATVAGGALFGAPLGMGATFARGAVGKVVATTPAGAAVSGGAKAIQSASSATMPAGSSVPVGAARTTAAAEVTNASAKP